jgi:hypothetical protein
MKRDCQFRFWGASLAAALGLFAGCQAGEPRPDAAPHAKVEVRWVAPDHRLEDCIRGEDLARSYVTAPDSVLFYSKERDTIRVFVPAKGGAVRYHAHVLSKVGREITDIPFAEEESGGTITIPLSKFEDPDLLVITSCSRYVKSADHAEAYTDRPTEDETAGLVQPPYVLSLNLVAASFPQEIETILALNHFRTEVSTDAGARLYVMTAPFSRRDYLVTILDPRRTLTSIIDEEPEVYVPREDGVTPPRIRVDVLAGKVVWERVSTFPITESTDRVQGTAEKPLVLRTRKRELCSFVAPPRVDLAIPKDPPATSAVIEAKALGLGRGDRLQYILGCVYPVGPKGDYAARAQEHEFLLGAERKTLTVDVSHLQKFPVTAGLVQRLVQPWRLTSGRFAPEEPLGRVTVPLAPAPGGVTKFAKWLAPKFASHVDYLTFWGSAGRGKNSSAVIDDSADVPDDPNMAPPPPPPGGPGGNGPGGGGGPGTPPPQQPQPGFGFGGLGGGPPSYCGCGKDGGNCPNQQAPCRGHCGQACPGNGCCQNNNQKGGDWYITFPCPPKHQGCGLSEADCKCGNHQWSGNMITSTVSATLKAMAKNFADIDPPQPPSGWSPCHQWKHVCDVKAWFWNPNFGLGIGANVKMQYSKIYQIFVRFAPCVGGKPLLKKDKKKEDKTPYTGPTSDPSGSGTELVQATGTGDGLSPLTGATFTLDVVEPGNPISTSRTPGIDPNTQIDVALVANVLGGTSSGNGSLTATLGLNSVPRDTLSIDLGTLSGIVAARNAEIQAVMSAWVLRSVIAGDRPDPWNLSPPSSFWATYQSGQQPTTPPPPSSPPSSPPGPGPGPSSSVRPRS